MLELDYNPTLKMYVSAKPTPPVIELRAWCNLSTDPTLPAVLCEIVDVDKNIVQVKPIDRPMNFFVTRARVHKVHRASVTTGEVIQFLGEPKPC
jgi:hypothetical protein